ncbi:hypothetical protein OPV22_020457 [Ensete ventricosum]|uniref:Uncharacterized protein n=1 Tax=Ensete ventricosum TaxID=4639 RepID=A0AAV8QGG4_ENSVE|nr:hypothetical protein OPV22_020457 [Ensete ventricosum]
MMPSQPPPFLRVAAHFAFSGSVPTGQPTRDPTRLSHAIRCSPQHRHRRNRSRLMANSGAHRNALPWTLSRYDRRCTDRKAVPTVNDGAPGDSFLAILEW